MLVLSNCGLLVLSEWFAFIGQKAAPGMPGSPYAINFKLNTLESAGMELMNLSVYSCSDSSLGCSCGDCPLSPICSSSEPPTPEKKESCTIQMGSLKVRVDVILLNYLSIIIMVCPILWII